MRHLSGKTFGFLAIKLQLPRIDLFQETNADAAELVVIRIGPQLLIREGKIAPKRLDLQVAELKRQLEVIAGRSQAPFKHLSGFIDPPSAAMAGGQLQIAHRVGWIRG